jgi:hypothetical protein
VLHEAARVTQPFRVVLLYRLFKRGDVPRALMSRPLVDDVRRHFASIFNTLPLPISFVASENFSENDDGYYPEVQTDLSAPRLQTPPNPYPPLQRNDHGGCVGRGTSSGTYSVARFRSFL